MIRAGKTGAGIVALLFLGIVGCGGLRYSEIAPAARDFHPQRIALLPADTTAFPAAKDDVDRLFDEVVSETKWFTVVVGGTAVARRMETDAELRQTVTQYLGKLRNVNYSDAELTARIGVLTGTDAFLMVRVDYWNYTTEKDDKVCKVALTVRMVEAKTGTTLWAAIHNRVSNYLIVKPDLPDVARALIREMIGYMPH